MNELNNNLNIKQDDMLNRESEIGMNNSKIYNDVNNEELINAYIGKGAEKIRKGKFSLWACFFGTTYVFYRKMWLLGLVWYLINIFIALTAAFITLKVFNIVELLQSSTYSITTIVVFVSSCIVNIIISFLFKKLYIKKSEKKVEKIKQKNSYKTNEELKKICAKKGGTTIIGIVVAILLSGVVETVCEPIVEKIVSNEIHNKFAKETAYSIISEVEYAYTQAFLTSGKDTLILEDIKNEYNGLSSTWNKDNTITSKHYDVVCNVTVNNDNKMIVECDVNGKIIESEPLSMNLNQNNNENIDEKDRISFNIINETIEGGVNLKKLYINNKLVDLKGSYSGIKVTQLNDILIVEASNASSTLFAVDKNANVVSVFVPENNNYYENIQKIVTKYNYRDTYRIDDNNLYITTDRLSQDSQYIVCNMITNDNDIVVYEEKFTYLGNNKFSNSVVVNTITRKQYMQEHNISCNKPVEDNNGSVNNDTESISIFPIKDGKTIKFYKMINNSYNSNDYKNEKEISTYTCENEKCNHCYAYTFCSNVSILGNNLITLYDYNNGQKVDYSGSYLYPAKLIIWNAVKGKEVARYNDIIAAYSLGVNADTEYLVIENKNNQNAIIDLKGNYIKNFSNKKYVIASYEGRWIDGSSYTIENDLIVTIKNNKYGIENIKSDKVVIEHKYDEILLYDSFVVQFSEELSVYDLSKLYAGKYFKARIGNKWSLYNVKTGNKVINKEYDRIYLLDDETIAVYNDGYLSFIDYKGNSVSDDKIKISDFLETMPKNPEGIRFTIGDSVVKIFISEGTDISNFVNSNYEYNLKTKKLTKLI